MHWRKRGYNPVADLSVVGNILMVHSKLDDMPVEDLNNVMSQFISEIRKEKVERYPGKTLHELVSSLQKYFEIRGRKINFFTDAAFEKLGKALDLEMKVSARNSIGLKPKQAEVFMQEMEDSLWEKQHLGSENPEMLLRTTSYLIGLNFRMRGGDELRQLTINKCSVVEGFQNFPGSTVTDNKEEENDNCVKSPPLSIPNNSGSVIWNITINNN